MRTQHSLLFLAAFVLSACNCNPKPVPDAGEPDASVEVDAGFDAGIDVPDAGEEDAGPPPMSMGRMLHSITQQ